MTLQRSTAKGKVIRYNLWESPYANAGRASVARRTKGHIGLGKRQVESTHLPRMRVKQVVNIAQTALNANCRTSEHSADRWRALYGCWSSLQQLLPLENIHGGGDRCGLPCFGLLKCPVKRRPLVRCLSRHHQSRRALKSASFQWSGQ